MSTKGGGSFITSPMTVGLAMIGVAAVAATGVLLYARRASAGSSGSVPPVTTPPATPGALPGSWQPVNAGDDISQGGTFIMSLPAIAGVPLAAVQTDAPSGAQLWDKGQVPSGWPPSDLDPNRWRVEATLPPGVQTMQSFPTGAKIWRWVVPVSVTST